MTNKNVVIGRIRHHTLVKKMCKWSFKHHTEGKLYWLPSITSGPFHMINGCDNYKWAKSRMAGRQLQLICKFSADHKGMRPQIHHHTLESNPNGVVLNSSNHQNV